MGNIWLLGNNQSVTYMLITKQRPIYWHWQMLNHFISASFFQIHGWQTDNEISKCYKGNTETRAGVLLVSAWWRHQLETFPALVTLWEGNSPVIGEFPSQRPVTRSFDVFFDLRLNKRLNKHSRLWWFETPSRSLWCHCNVTTLTPLLVFPRRPYSTYHYNDVIMDAMASQITSISSVCSTICTSIDQRKHQSPASLACVRGIHWWRWIPLTKIQ